VTAHQRGERGTSALDRRSSPDLSVVVKDAEQRADWLGDKYRGGELKPAVVLAGLLEAATRVVDARRRHGMPEDHEQALTALWPHARSKTSPRTLDRAVSDIDELARQAQKQWAEADNPQQAQIVDVQLRQALTGMLTVRVVIPALKGSDVDLLQAAWAYVTAHRP
jgi:hypothetical protein